MPSTSLVILRPVWACSRRVTARVSVPSPLRKVRRTQVSSFGRSSNFSRSEPDRDRHDRRDPDSATSSSPGSAVPCARRHSMAKVREPRRACAANAKLCPSGKMIALSRAVFPAPLKPLISVISRPRSRTNGSGSLPSGPQWRCKPANLWLRRLKFHMGFDPSARLATTDGSRNSPSRATRSSLISLAWTCRVRRQRSRLRA